MGGQTDMHPVQFIALYAILLREAGRNHHTDLEAHLEDAEAYRGELSMATLLAGWHFTDVEWKLAELLYDGDAARIIETASVLHEHGEPVLAEGLLHAWGPNGARSRGRWASPYLSRWRQVRAAIRAFEAEGLAQSFGELERAAEHAYVEATGSTYEELDEQFEVAVGG